MALKDLRIPGRRPKDAREPRALDDHSWLYEMPDGLLVVHEVREKDGGYIRTDQILIPWVQIVSALFSSREGMNKLIAGRQALAETEKGDG